MHYPFLLSGLLLNLCTAANLSAAGQIPLESLLKPPAVDGVKLSPDGKYLALAVSTEDRGMVVVMERASGKTTTQLPLGKDNHVEGFEWVTDDRLIVTPAIRIPATEVLVATGELYGIYADGRRPPDYLFGYRIGISAAAYVLEPRADAKRRILIAVQSFKETREPGFLRMRWLQVDTHTITSAGRLPVRHYGSHLADPDGQLTFVSGIDNDRKQRLYWRPDRESAWELLNDASATGRIIEPLAYARDGKQVYARVDDGKGAAYLVRFDPTTGTQKVLLPPKTASIGDVVRTADGRSAFALRTNEGRGGYALIDRQAPEAELTRALMTSFPGEQVIPSNFTRDGRYAVVVVGGDVNPGTFYLHDAASSKLAIVSARYPDLQPEALSPSEPIALKSRDGLDLHGFLTRPVGITADATGLPLVVLPHGGPYGIADEWGFDPEVQLLASRGYAVLQINFRGSGGYGQKFEDAGIGEWGGRMQDDVTDATRWAIAQKIADPARICILGGSYGGYSALMGVVAEPELYRCAVGMAGVYDLELFKKRSAIRRTKMGRSYFEEVFGMGPEELRRRSPALRAGEIKAAVMLVHGGQDSRVPPEQAEGMKKALEKAGHPPRWLFEPREGHGFIKTANRVKLYQAVLDFLDQHIGAKAKS
jgi:dipeptidyl aminopeptidase/acylaminoacyl peptidase